MKRILLLLASLAVVAAVRADVETYTIDPVHSSTNFTLRHLFSDFTSKFTKTSGTITYDSANPENSHVEATVEIGSLDTADPKRNQHILSDAFFDAAKFPTATFKSKSWKKTGENTFDVTGDLTIKDVTKEEVFQVTLNGTGPGMRPGSFVSGWKATAAIKKSDFKVIGPDALLKVLGDDVTLNISIEAGYKK
jgi:polyisoprenoid-binding protein YceI